MRSIIALFEMNAECIVLKRPFSQPH